MTQLSSPAGRHRLVLVAVPILAVVLFLPSLGHDFVGWDDTRYVAESALTVQLDGLARIWASREAEQYYPLTFSSFWLEYRLWGANPLGYHTTNLLLHGLNSWLVLLLLRALRLGIWPQLFVGSLFAVHPVQVMTVSWIAQRKNLLSCAFLLLALLAWIHYRRSGRGVVYALALAAFVAALLSKSAVLTLPLALIVLDRRVLGVRSWRASLRSVLPLCVPIVISAALTVGFEQAFVESMPARELRPLIAAAALWFYGARLLLPLGMSPIYPRWEVSLATPTWWIPLLGWIVVGVVLWRRWDRLDGRVAYGLAHFVVFLLPMLGFLDYGNLALTYVSDHYLYIPGIGGLIALGLPLARLRSGSSTARRLVDGAALGLLVAAVGISLAYQPVFRDGEAVWNRTLEFDPQSAVAHAGLGRIHEQRHEYSQAVEHYRRASELMPRVVPAREDLCRTLLRGRQVEAARVCYLDLLELDPQAARAHGELGGIYLGLLRRAEAERHFRAALRISPGEARLRLGLATALRGQRQPELAIAVLREGLRADPDEVSLLNFLARILATSPDPGSRDGRSAAELARRAERLTAGLDYRVLETLAAAYAEIGRWPEARAAATRAMELARATGDEPFARVAAERLELYRLRQPLREVVIGGGG